LQFFISRSQKKKIPSTLEEIDEKYGRKSIEEGLDSLLSVQSRPSVYFRLVGKFRLSVQSCSMRNAGLAREGP